MNYNPTGPNTPNPILLEKLTPEYIGVWIPVTDALPPQRVGVVVMVRGDNCPAYGWLKFSAGDRLCPYFVVPQIAAMKDRGTDVSKPQHAKHRTDVTHWWSPSPSGLPHGPSDSEQAEWGLSGCGWETKEHSLNPELKA